MAEKHYGVVSLDELTTHNGIDFLKGIIEGRQPHPPMCKTFGFHLVDVANGRAVFEGIPRYEHYNPIAPCTAASRRRCSIPRWPMRSSRRCARARRGPRSN